eukprot:IDg19057t1
MAADIPSKATMQLCERGRRTLKSTEALRMFSEFRCILDEGTQNK